MVCQNGSLLTRFFYNRHTKEKTTVDVTESDVKMMITRSVIDMANDNLLQNDSSAYFASGVPEHP